MRGYLVQRPARGPFPAVLGGARESRTQSLHRGRGAPRGGRGVLALAPDGLFPVGGYPGNDDDGRTLQASLDPAKLRTDMLKARASSRRTSFQRASSSVPPALQQTRHAEACPLKACAP